MLGIKIMSHFDLKKKIRILNCNITDNICTQGVTYNFDKHAIQRDTHSHNRY